MRSTLNSTRLPEEQQRRPGNTAEQIYKQESLEFLKHSFPIISVQSIRTVFQANAFSFPAAYRHLAIVHAVVERSAAKGTSQDNRLLRILKKAPCLEGLKQSIVLKNKRSSMEPFVTSEYLVRELGDLPGADKKRTVSKPAAITSRKETPPSQQNEVAAIQSPFIDLDVARMPSPKKREPTVECEITCECCFGDYAFEEMVQCDEGAHLFCMCCVKEHVREQLYGNNRSVFPCMSSDGCTASFSSHATLERALSPKLLRNVEAHSYHEELSKAKVAGLWTCPFCSYLVVIPESIDVVKCPDTACQKASCLHCKEPPHANQTCLEAKTETEKNNAHAKMANALTQAVMRNCPSCHISIMKESGCNMMKCPVLTCNTKFCYCCGKPITGYTHFCQVPHCTHEKCGQCLVFSNTEEDDKRARREAGVKEQAAIGDAAKNLGLLSPEKENAVQMAAPMIHVPPVVHEAAGNIVTVGMVPANNEIRPDPVAPVLPTAPDPVANLQHMRQHPPLNAPNIRIELGGHAHPVPVVQMQALPDAPDLILGLQDDVPQPTPLGQAQNEQRDQLLRNFGVFGGWLRHL